MCEFIPVPDGTIPAAGQARRLDLYQSVANDLQSGDRTLTRALTQWRNEVVSRLGKKGAVARIRLPWVFVGTLQLADQTVLLFEDGAVCIGGLKENGHFVPGPLLISAKET